MILYFVFFDSGTTRTRRRDMYSFVFQMIRCVTIVFNYIPFTNSVISV